MTEQFPAVIVLAPLFGSLLVVLFGRRHEGVCLPLVVVSLVVSVVAAVGTCMAVLEAGGPISYHMGGWAPEAGELRKGIELRVDALNGIVLLVITVVALLNAFYSRVPVATETPSRLPYFYALYLLLIAGLAGITLTNDAFNLYVLIEICSLTSYALIAMGRPRAVLSSFNYVIMGVIGASFYLLGVGYLYIKTGSLNMVDIRAIIAEEGLAESQTIRVAAILILIGVWIKMAFFPLHGWLPNAYAYSPTTTGTIMAPLMTKVMVYVMIRVMLTAFGADYVFDHLGWSHGIVWLSVIAIVAGSVLALTRMDIRKMLTYLIVAEVGYMVGGAWLANAAGMTGAIYHIASDAAMTFCLFLAAGIVINRTGEHRLNAFDGAFAKLPLTMTGFTIGALSMIGLPPTCGFFSKWYLLQGGIETGHWGFVVALLFSSLVNAILFFRIFERALLAGVEHKPKEMPTDADAMPETVVDRVPWSMLGPLLLSAVGLLIIGVFNRAIVAWIGTVLDGI